MATVTLKGNPIHTIGDLPALGAKAPDFKLVDGDLKDVSLATFQGKRKVLNIVPSLDTSVCATSTRKFNEKAGALRNTVVLVVSSDPTADAQLVAALRSARCLCRRWFSGVSPPSTPAGSGRRGSTR